ncbi:hypothetical protein HPB51_005844 [Rhipicephalus microplus]|uniref:Lateral signaling target protein 2 n=1 Tax=Rhipicephalus microplus TaxID=6941 RepID=A0A9J6D421_RHIMP|nr:hypothetical protein HPB51_005844 [Rhipicephalus microplus]
MMNSLRIWFYRPKKEDNSALAQFYWADQELNLVATELDSFDGRKDPERCSALINQLRVCQDRVLGICNDIMDEAIPNARANRDFRAKFPDDVLQENMSGLLWFGAECLAAGSNIMNREQESSQMRPLARALTRSLDNVRCLLREQCFRNLHEYPEKLKESLKTFDRLFAEFELSYVSAILPVKSAKEYHLQQEVVVLFSETLQRAIEVRLVPQEMVETYDPALMFTIPRLAIVAGLVLFPDGPLNVDKDSSSLSELFRPFYSLLCKIRELLWTLSREELWLLEKPYANLKSLKLGQPHYELRGEYFAVLAFPCWNTSLPPFASNCTNEETRSGRGKHRLNGGGDSGLEAGARARLLFSLYVDRLRPAGHKDFALASLPSSCFRVNSVEVVSFRRSDTPGSRVAPTLQVPSAYLRPSSCSRKTTTPRKLAFCGGAVTPDFLSPRAEPAVFAFSLFELPTVGSPESFSALELATFFFLSFFSQAVTDELAEECSLPSRSCGRRQVEHDEKLGSLRASFSVSLRSSHTRSMNPQFRT